jgi:hypothetical protein
VAPAQIASRDNGPRNALAGVVVGVVLSLGTYAAIAWLYRNTAIVPGALLTDRLVAWPPLVVVGAIGAVFTLVLRRHRSFGTGLIVGAVLWALMNLGTTLIEDDVLERIRLLRS